MKPRENRFRFGIGASLITLTSQLKGRDNLGAFACRRRFLLADFRCAIDARESVEMRGRLRMARCMDERTLHRALGVFDGAPAMTNKAVIDPGLGPAWLEPHSFRESALGLGDFIAGEQSAAIRIMCLRQLWRAVTGFACGAQRMLRLFQIKKDNRSMHERRRVVRHEFLCRHKAVQSFRMLTETIQRDAKLE
jgi:hypothetical protein